MPPESSPQGTHHTGPGFPRQRKHKRRLLHGQALLDRSLRSYDLFVRHTPIAKIAKILRVSEKTVDEDLARARKLIDASAPSLKDIAIHSVMISVNKAWERYDKARGGMKLAWFQAALKAMYHRDRLLGLLSPQSATQTHVYAGPQGAGVRVTRLSIDERVKIGADEYERAAAAEDRAQTEV